MIFLFDKKLKYPKSVEKVRNASNNLIYQWKHYDCNGYLDFIVSLALEVEYEKRFSSQSDGNTSKEGKDNG